MSIKSVDIYRLLLVLLSEIQTISRRLDQLENEIKSDEEWLVKC